MPTYAVTVAGSEYEVDAPNEKTAWAWANQTHSQSQVPAVAPTTSTQRTWGEAATDVGAGLASGLGSILQVPGQLTKLVPGLYGFGEAIETPGEAIAKFGEGLKSQGLKAREALRSQAISDAEKEGILAEFATAIGQTIKDPALFTSFIAQQVPQLLGPAAAVKVAKLATAAKVAGAAEGLTGEAAALATKQATEAAQQTAARAAMGTGAVMQSADVGNDAFNRAMDVLKQQYPEMSDEERQSQALNVARQAAIEGGLFSLASMNLPGIKGTGAIERRLAGLPGVGRAKSALGESLEEIVEEGGGAFSQNVSLRQIDPTQSLTQGVGSAAGLGAIGGGVLGGILGHAAPPPELAPGQRPGETLEQSITRLQREILAETQPPAPPPAEPDFFSLATKPNGYGLLEQAKQQLLQGEQTDRVKQYIGEIEQLQGRITEEEASRQAPSALSLEQALGGPPILAQGDIADILANDPTGAGKIYQYKSDLINYLDQQTKQNKVVPQELLESLKSADALLGAYNVEDVRRKTTGAKPYESAFTPPPPPPSPITVVDDKVARGLGFVPSKSGKGIYNQIVNKDLTDPAQLQEVRSALETYVIKGNGAESTIARVSSFLKSIPRGEADVGTPVTPPSGEGAPVAIEPSAGAAPAGVGVTQPSGVVPAVEDAGLASRGEEGKPAAIEDTRKAQLLNSIGFLNQQNLEANQATITGVSPEGMLQINGDFQKAPRQAQALLNTLREAQQLGATPQEISDAALSRIKPPTTDVAVETAPVAPPPQQKQAPRSGLPDTEVGGAPATEEGTKPKKSLAAVPPTAWGELERRAKATREAPPKETAPEEKPTQQLTPETQKKIKQLQGLLKTLMNRFGLKDVGLNLVNDLEANGEYANKLIKLALDAVSPVRDLRHESLHALKELGFFTPQQWAVLEKKAKDTWINQFLKQRNVNGFALQEGEKSRYDAYVEMFTADQMSLDAMQEALIEEAISDAFGEFDVNKAPVGLMQAILKRMKTFFAVIKEALGQARIESAEDIFERVEKGALKPSAIAKEAADKLSLRRLAVKDEIEISTQNPSGPKRIYDPIAQMLSIDEKAVMETMHRNPEYKEAVIKAIRSYGFMPPKVPAKDVIPLFKKNIINNLLYLYNKVPPEIRERSKLWYDGANKIAQQMADKYDLSLQQVSAIMAAMSPQKDWFQNVSMGERAIDILTEQGDRSWSPEMLKYAESYVNETKDRAEREKRQEAFDRIKRVAEKGTTLNDMDVESAAAFIRAYDEAFHSRQYRLVTPEGGFGGLVRNNDGTPSTMMWSNYSPIEKAVSIFRDGSRENISEQLGFEHKIRSFYNNIAAPQSQLGHVTIDTHAVAAALFEALAGTDLEVLQNFGGGKVGGTNIIGVSGTYGLIADAYREAAAQVGVLPREMQSITWEAVRGLFSEEFKNAIKSPIRAEWAKYKAGQQTFEQTRENILEIARNKREDNKLVDIPPPDWVGTDEGQSVQFGGESYDKDYTPEGGVRLRESKEIRDKLTFNLSAVTKSIPGLDELYRRALKRDTKAIEVLQTVAESSLKHLLSDVPARISIERAKGVYMADREPSLMVQVAFDERHGTNVMAALERFAKNFNQEQIHVRMGTKKKFGFEYDDGSYVTTVFTSVLKKDLTDHAISSIIDKSGLKGFTVTKNQLITYFVKPVRNEGENDEQYVQRIKDDFKTFTGAAKAAHELVGVRGTKLSSKHERLFVYGSGVGAAIGYDRISGDVRTKQGADTVTPRIIAEYLTGQPVQVFKQKPLNKVQVKEQTKLAQAYETLPINDLKNPLVKKAYKALTKALKEQFAILPVKTEFQTERYKKDDRIPDGFKVGDLKPPYENNSAAMRLDILENNRLIIYPTSPDTFGPPGSDFTGHPLLEDSGLKTQDGKPMLFNDVLRAVHDYFAHGMSEAQFGPVGEYTAWRNHMASTSDPLARWALTAETRLQNAWQNFRPEVAQLAIKDRPFALQKASLPPVEFLFTGDKSVDAPVVEMISGLSEQDRKGSKPQKGAKASLRAPQTEAFKRWFGDSKVVDENGEPLVVYHGTKQDITAFDTEKEQLRGTLTESDLLSPMGSHFGKDPQVANNFAAQNGSSVYPAYLSIKNPKRYSKEQDLRDELIKQNINTRDVDDVLSNPESFANYAESDLRSDKSEQERIKLYDTSSHYREIVNGAIYNYLRDTAEPTEINDFLQELSNSWKAAHPNVDGIIYENGAANEVRGAKYATSYIVFRPEQIKSAIGNIGAYGQRPVTTEEARRFGMTAEEANAAQKQGDIRFSLRDKLGMYSELENKIAQGSNKAPAASWKAYINGLTQKGVKPEEIEWSGVRDWLDLQKGTVTKDDLLNYLKQGGVKVEETQSPVGESIGIGDYRSLQLPGGTNYREVLLTLPVRVKSGEVSPRAERVVRDLSNDVLRALPEEAIASYAKAIGEQFDVPTAEMELAIRAARGDREATIGFRSNHWDQPNVLAHIRLNDRTDADGNKVLFVEELQSDWGQEGKKQGFRSQEKKPLLVQPGEREELFAEMRRRAKERAIRAGFNESDAQVVADNPNPRVLASSAGMLQDLEALVAREDQDRINMGRDARAIPPAPFVTKTEGWLNLALKRIMVMAAEGGYDKVAFVNGEQSADRYRLSKEVDEIHWRTYRSGEKAATLDLKNKDSITFLLDETGFVTAVEGYGTEQEAQYVGKGFDEIVGKEITNKILDEPRGILEGRGVDIGGKGMKAFYDQIVPIAVKKLLPKVGGGQMAEVQVPDAEAERGKVYDIVVASERVADRDLPVGSVVETHTSRRIAEQAMEGEGGYDKRDYRIVERNAGNPMLAQPGFDVTPAMREKVETTGLPRFSIRDKKSVRNNLSPATRAEVDRVTTARYEPGFVERITKAIAPEAFSKLRAQALNRYNQLSVYDKLKAKKMGGVELLADQSAEAAALMSDLGAGVTAQAMGVHDRVGGIPVYRNGYTTVSNEGGTVKGIIAIFAPLAKYGDPEVYRDFQFWAGSKRGSRFLADGKEQLYTQANMKQAQEILKVYPEFENIFKEWTKYNEGLVKYMVDTGVISAENGKKFVEHSDYIPFYRQIDGETTVGPNIFQSIAGVKAPKKLKGGEQPLADFLETIVRNTQASIQAGLKNVAAQRAVKMAEDIGQAARLPNVQAGVNIVTVLENGKKVSYDCNDPLFINAVKSLNLPDLPFIGLLAGPANLLRNLVTKDPGFMLANMMRDSMSAMVTSGVNMTPIVSTIKNFGDVIAGKSPEYDALLKAGVLGGYDYSAGVEASAQQLAKELRKEAKVSTAAEKAMRPATWLWEALEKGTQASDAATRIEVYKKTLEATGNEAEALFRALEVMNFNRKGSSAVIRIATAAIPFLNARMQGLDVLYRAAISPSLDVNANERAKQIQKTFFVRGMTIAALSCMYWMMTHDDDEYKKQEQETRDNYWLFPKLGIKIPIPFEIGIIFKVIPERIMAYSFGDDTGKDFMKSMQRNFENTLPITPMGMIPQLAKPYAEVTMNYSLFTGRPIIGQGMETVAPKYQSLPMTATFLKDLGKELNISPIKMEYLIRGYTGTMGAYMVDAIDSIYNMHSDAPKAAKRFEQMPVLKRFAIDPDARGTVTAYYDLKNATDTVVRTSNYLERTQNYEEYSKYLKDNYSALAVHDFVLDMNKTLDDFNEYKQMIRGSKMDPERKRDALLQITRAENQLTANIQQLRKMAGK